MEGKVIKSTGSEYLVALPDGTVRVCKLKGKFRMQGIRSTNPVAVGDEVILDPGHAADEGIISGIQPRRNYLVRRSINLSKASHILASNLDMLWVVGCVIKPRTSTGFIDRVLVTAEAYHIPAGIVFNKTDIYTPAEMQQCHELAELYRSIGYPVLLTSATEGDGVQALCNELRDRVSLFTGHSGVGKSALLNAIDPSLNAKTGEISDAHNKGMHTTTFAEMRQLHFGGWIIDTPGIKEFGLIHFDSSEICERFPEFRTYLNQCRFDNCTHIHEPGCAVKSALDQGKIPPSRYRNYLGMVQDNQSDPGFAQ